MRVRVPPPALQLVVVRNLAHRTPATTRHYRYGSPILDTPILDTHHLAAFWNSSWNSVVEFLEFWTLEFWNSGHAWNSRHARTWTHLVSRLANSGNSRFWTPILDTQTPILDTHEVSRRRVPIHHHESGSSRILIWGRRGCLKQDPWRRWVLNCSDATGNDNFWRCQVVTYVGTVS